MGIRKCFLRKALKTDTLLTGGQNYSHVSKEMRWLMWLSSWNEKYHDMFGAKHWKVKRKHERRGKKNTERRRALIV